MMENRTEYVESLAKKSQNPEKALMAEAQEGSDLSVAQFDMSRDSSGRDFSALKRLQDHSKFEKARFSFRLYRK